MASRYHINNERNVGECSAEKGQCPFGGADAHFGSREQAEHAAEERLTARYGLTATTKKEKKINIKTDLTEMFAGLRRESAKNPNTSPETLAKLAEDEDRGVRETVAGNPNTPPETLAKLAGDVDRGVRWCVAANPNTPPETLAKLARDVDEDVRESVAHNPSTPFPELSRLTSDYDFYASDAARRTILSRASWSDCDKEIAEGLLDETRGKESGSYFPSLEALQEAVEEYKKASDGRAFDPSEGHAIMTAFILAESV